MWGRACSRILNHLPTQAVYITNHGSAAPGPRLSETWTMTLSIYPPDESNLKSRVQRLGFPTCELSKWHCQLSFSSMARPLLTRGMRSFHE